VGILDDDPGMKGRSFHGIPILGRPSDLERVLRERSPIAEVILSVPPDPDTLADLRARVHAAGARLVLAPSALRFTEV
jgi:hypothetical protein